MESYFLYLWLLKLSYCFLNVTLIMFFFFFSRRNFFISCSSVTWGSITPPLQPGLQFSSAFFFLCCLFRDLVLFIMVSINSLLQGSLNSFNNFRYERKKEKKYRLNNSKMWRECIERFLWVVTSIKNFIQRAKEENHIEHNNENYHGTLQSN